MSPGVAVRRMRITYCSNSVPSGSPTETMLSRMNGFSSTKRSPKIFHLVGSSSLSPIAATLPDSDQGLCMPGHVGLPPRLARRRVSGLISLTGPAPMPVPDWSRRRQAEVVAEVEFVVAWLVATALERQGAAVGGAGPAE